MWVPQGSILGPILFIIYTADLAPIVAKHGLSLHQDADDIARFMALVHPSLSPLCQPIFLFVSTRFPAGCPRIGSSSMPTRPRRCDVRQHIGSCSFLAQHAVLSQSLVRPLSQSTLSVVSSSTTVPPCTHDRIIEEPCHVALQQLRHLRHYITSDCFRCSLVVSFVHFSLD